MKIGVAQPVGGDAVQCWGWNYAAKCGWRGKADMSGAFHLTFSASEVFLGVAVSDWPLPYGVLTYRSPSFVIFVVQPVFQVITAELPSSFQVPVIPSPRVAFAAPSLDSVISNGCPAVSFTFHTPSKALAASAAKLVTTKKQAAVTAAVAAFLIFEVGCVGQRLLEHGGHAISRNDIKPHARTDDDSGCLGLRVAALRGKEDVDLTSNIKIVCSTCKAGINHWSTGRCEWAGAIRHDRCFRDRSGRDWRIVKVEDPHGQTELGRQLLDRADTPTGQHRLQITSPRLRGHKTPRIAVGAVNHPLRAA